MLRKPTVFNTSTGRYENLQGTDTLDATLDEVNFSTLTNNNASPILKGFAVYKNGTADQVDLADATSGALAQVIGLVDDTSIANAATGRIITSGRITVADWTGITGAAALTPGADYWLDFSGPGLLTTTIPVIPGNYRVYVGEAVDAQTLEVKLERPVLI